METPSKRGPKHGGIKFGPHVRVAAVEQKISQASLARAAGVNTSTMSRLFSGEIGCNSDIADVVAEQLGMSRDELVSATPSANIAN